MKFDLMVAINLRAFGESTLQLGDFDQDTYKASPAALFMVPMFVGFTFMINIVALNSLIALMGDSWERTQETATARGLQQRAQLMCEMELSMSAKEKADQTLFPTWLHCLQRLDDDDDAADDWQGRIVALRRTVDATARETQEKLDRTARETQQKLDRFDNKFEALDTKLDTKL